MYGSNQRDTQQGLRMKKGGAQMELFITIALPIAFMTVLAIVALTFGADSRPSIGDDHARWARR